MCAVRVPRLQKEVRNGDAVPSHGACPSIFLHSQRACAEKGATESVFRGALRLLIVGAYYCGASGKVTVM